MGYHKPPASLPKAWARAFWAEDTSQPEASKTVAPKQPGKINDLSDESMSMTKNQQTSCFLFAASVCRCSIFENRLAFKCGKSSKQHTPVQMLVDLAKLLSDAKHREHCSAARSLTWQANKHITYKNNRK